MGTTAVEIKVTPLTLVAEVAAVLAGEADIVKRATQVLGLLMRSLGASESSLWLATPNGLVLAARAGVHTTPAELLAQHLDGGAITDGPFALRPLICGTRRLGALVVRIEAGIAPDASEAVTAITHMLAPALAHAEQTRAFQAEVERRTRQVEGERRFIHQVVDSLPVSLYVVDRDFRINVWNRTREGGSQGVRREQALGKTIFEILHRAPAEKLRTELDEVFRTGRMQQFSMESRATGEPRTYRITKIPMQLVEGEPISHVITIGEDVTDMATSQERFAQSERLAAMGQMAAGVMHEINNPLATIGACQQSLHGHLSALQTQGATIPDAMPEMLRIIGSEVERCKGIVGSLLEFSRPDSKDKTPQRINAIAEQALSLLKHQPQFKRLSLQTFLDPEVPEVAGNAEQLMQVVIALLQNAADAMTQDGTVTVRTRCGTSERDAVVVEVIDEGQGIARADLPHIFEPFYSTKGPGRGTGLGLSICYAIVSDHGGRLEVDSAVGAGSTFRILLPGVTPQ